MTLDSLLPILAAVAGTLLAPVAVGLALGLDRQATASVQLRTGPPVLQSLYDLTKLLAKASPATDRWAAGLLVVHVILAAGALAAALAGGDLLVAVLVLGAARIAFILAAGAVESPYAQVGAMREVVLLVALEPLLLLVVLAYGTATGSFSTAAIAAAEPPVVALPTLGVTLAIVLAGVLRKSPFDLASSDHAHQELVKGSTTEMAGRWLALADLGHWYETALVALLIVLGGGRLRLVGVGLLLTAWIVVILVDNAMPRATWRSVLAIALGVGGAAAVIALVMARLATGAGILP